VPMLSMRPVQPTHVHGMQSWNAIQTEFTWGSGKGSVCRLPCAVGALSTPVASCVMALGDALCLVRTSAPQSPETPPCSKAPIATMKRP
jgi:hypothetical protein